MATRVRRTVLSLPGAPLGPENPLPDLLPPDQPHRTDEAPRATLPADMARQMGYAPLRSVLPVRRRDGYRRQRGPMDLDAIVIENDRLRATVLPGLGGRVYSLYHKPTRRELLYRNPVFQPADFALNGAWFSGGIEWNIGATGHTTLSCAPLHAARVAAPDGDVGAPPAVAGGEMLRLWEWERLRGVPFQVDLWLPDGSDFLYAGIRVRNPHDHRVPVYWWSNTAVPETGRTRVLVPADEAWRFGYTGGLSRVPVPEWDGADRSYPLHGEHPADYFYALPDSARRWIAALDGDGTGLVQTSTATLRGRKLFLWGAGPGGRRWQRWLTEPGTDGYAEIQAGLARTQLEHVPLEAGEEFSWLEAYGPLTADPATVHGADWAAARAAAEARLAEALPPARVEAAYAAWLRRADSAPKEMLATGSGWGALEVERAGYELPGTPFAPEALGAEQRPWRALLRTGTLPEWAPGAVDPGVSLVGPAWREHLETAPSGAAADYHLGVAQWHAGDRAQAARSWERSLRHAETPWALRCLAVADAASGDLGRAADRLLRAVRLLPAADPADVATRTAKQPEAAEGGGTAEGIETAEGAEAAERLEAAEAAEAALGREAVTALLAAGRADQARAVLDALRPALLARGRFQLLLAQVLLAQADAPAARAVFDRNFEVDDLREGDETLGDTWYAIAERLVAGEGGAVTEEVRARARAEHPLPEHYEYRMRPC